MLGYSETSKAFRVHNSISLKVEKAILVKFNHEPDLNKSELDDTFSKLQIDDTSPKETNTSILSKAFDDPIPILNVQ